MQMRRGVHLLKELYLLGEEEGQLLDKATQTGDRHQVEGVATDHRKLTAKTRGNFKEMGAGCRLRSSKATFNRDHRR